MQIWPKWLRLRHRHTTFWLFCFPVRTGAAIIQTYRSYKLTWRQWQQIWKLFHTKIKWVHSVHVYMCFSLSPSLCVCVSCVHKSIWRQWQQTWKLFHTKIMWVYCKRTLCRNLSCTLCACHVWVSMRVCVCVCLSCCHIHNSWQIVHKFTRGNLNIKN